MAFTRKTYTGPVKNRGTIARGGKKLADVSKEELDAFRKKAGNEDLSYKEALRKLLNADRNAKPAATSNVTPRKVSDADIARAEAGAAKARAAREATAAKEKDASKYTTGMMGGGKEKDASKYTTGMMDGGKVKGYRVGGDVKGYGKARGAKACKMS